MCTLSGITFGVGRRDSSLEYAEVACRINFTQTERDLNLRFRVSADLYERDDDLDFYFLGSAASSGQLARGNRDDFVGRIGTQYVRPEEQAFANLSFERDWDFGNRESGNEEYRVIVKAFPDIRGDIAISREVSANLG